MTYSIAKEYNAKDPLRFIVLQNDENKGLNYTLNKCIDIARGKYIARMDGDDISKPDRLEKELQFLESNPEFSIVSCDMEMFDKAGVWGRTFSIARPEINDFCNHSPFFCHAAVLVRTDAYRAVGGYTVNPHLLRVEDCHLWYKMYAAGYKGANIQEVLYSMRNDRNATSRRTMGARVNGIYVTWVGFHLVKMPWYKYIYFLRTLFEEPIKAIIPAKVYEHLYKHKHGSLL